MSVKWRIGGKLSRVGDKVARVGDKDPQVGDNATIVGDKFYSHGFALIPSEKGIAYREECSIT